MKTIKEIFTMDVRKLTILENLIGITPFIIIISIITLAYWYL